MKEATFLQKLRCPYVWMTAAATAFASPLSVLADDKDVTNVTNKVGNGANPDFSGAATPVVTLINNLLGPIISVVAALGAIYCVFLGVKLAKAEEPQEREKAKMALKNAIIGCFLIFVLIVVMRIMLPQLIGWVNANKGGSGAGDIAPAY